MHRVGSSGNTSNSVRNRKEKRLTYVLNDADDTKHCAGINCLAVSKSTEQEGSDYLFTGSRDGTLKRWELSEDSATFSATFESHVDWVNDAVLTGGNTLVSCSSDTTVKVWNRLSDGICARTFHQHSDYVTCLAAAEKNSNVFASGGLGGEVFIWDLEAALNPISKLNDANADDCSTSTNGLGSLPSTSLRPINSSNNISVHATQSQGYVPIAAKGHKESVYALATNDRGTLLVSGGTEKVVRVWDPRSGSKTMKLRGHTDNIRALLLDSTGRVPTVGFSFDMATFVRPENALKRAEELNNVGQKQEALEALHSFITSRRYRAWTRTHEKIMFKYVELCVDMRRGRHAKDGLIQYRGICQQVNITSLEEVIKHFMQLATEKAELARNQAQALEEALDVDDLEADKRPEDLLLSYVSGEKGKDRSDRELVTPWFKFLWETYRSVLEILRNNSRLEALYAMTAHRAFQFCKQYKRTTEFRRLCEIIRNHLANLNKYRDQRDRPDLSVPESLQLYLDTRFEQLKVATELELWQEAFRSIEDIYGLMCIVKKTPKPSLMVVYYSKLSEIFWMSSNHLYHAYAWLKLFSLQKSFNKNLNHKDLQMIASSAVLAALSVPPYDRSYGASHLELGNEKERNFRVANLIAFDVESKPENREVHSRSSLLLDLVAKGIMNCVTQEVKDLYHILEHEFLPLHLALQVQPLLTKISKHGGKLASASSVPEVHLSQYVPSLEMLAALRLLQRVSQVYQTMTIDNLLKIIPFFDFPMVEKISVDAVKNNFLSMKVNYRKGAIFFGNKSLESEALRDHLSALAESLSKSRVMIYPPGKGTPKLGETLSDLVEVVEKEHKRLLARKSIIEKRKEEQERQLLEMEREEEAKRLKLQKITEEAEQKRLASEFEQMKTQRIRREIEERELEEAQALLQEAEKRSKKKGKKPVLEGEKLTKKSLMDLAVSEQLREKQEMEKRLQKLGKTMDYLERAKREEAAPLIEATFHKHLEDEKDRHELEQQREVDLSRQRHAGDLEEKRRLGRMLENKNIFQERVVNCRKAECDRLRQEREETINNIIQSRKQEREAKRKMIYFLRTEEERQRRLREEEEARKLEDMERRKKVEAERKAKLDEIAEKQRQRERELEEKERQRREEILGRSAAATATALPPKAMADVSSEAPPAAAAAPAPGKFVPRFRRVAAEGGGQAAATPPPATDKWSSGSRMDDRAPPPGDRWRDDSRPAAAAPPGGGRPTWLSSREQERRR